MVDGHGQVCPAKEILADGVSPPHPTPLLAPALETVADGGEESVQSRWESVQSRWGSVQSGWESVQSRWESV